MKGCLAAASGLLSACGIGLLVLDAQPGVGGWANVCWQAAGCAIGIACFRAVTRRAWRDGHALRAAASFTGSLLLVRWEDIPDFGIDRPLLAEIVRFAAVMVIGTLVLWRRYRRRPHEMPTMFDLCVVLLPVLGLTFCALLFRSTPAALTILIVTAIMLRVAGHSRGVALLPVLVPFAFLAVLVWLYPYRGLQLEDDLRHTIAMRVHAPERTFVGRFLEDRRLRAKGQRWFEFPPRAARQLAIAAVTAVSGYPGAAAVAVLFGIVGWLGFRCVTDDAPTHTRMMVAGMTATLVVPAALHIVGCLGLLDARAGPLPFVSYGPAELVMAWTALGFVAAGESRSRTLLR
jgi:cell division protein FtsW (lipid II flippase)